MIGDSTAGQNQSQSFLKPQTQRSVVNAQEKLYGFLLEVVKNWTPEEALAEFKSIFINHAKSTQSDMLSALQEILFANQEQEFRNTLKRSCYILVNNWEITRNYSSIQQLTLLFSEPILDKPSILPVIRRLREWVKSFAQSRDFQELKLFAARYSDRPTTHWSHRYTSYLLVPQYINLDNPFEQRQAARNLHRKLKDQFKFDLAMYTAHSEPLRSEAKFKNPTCLGDEVVHLIKRIVAKRGVLNYSNLAQIFLRQIQDLEYRDFKHSLVNYLIFSTESGDITDTIKKHLTEKLDSLYVHHDDAVIDQSLLLRTANRLIECFTSEDRKEPSPLFVLLLSQGASLTLVIVLLKIVLICRHAQTHLEARIADVIQYYEKCPEEDCQWIIHFLEIFNITMTIHTGNVEYSLINMAKYSNYAKYCSTHGVEPTKLDNYRIFSQLKQTLLSNELEPDEPDLLELAALELLEQEKIELQKTG